MIEGFENAAACWKKILGDKSRKDLLAVVERFARENTLPSPVVFGTSGWRGEIGTDYTFNNLRIVTEAILSMFKKEDPSVMAAIGISGFDEIRKRGVIVGHDNRFLGRDFAMEVMGRLQKHGIRTWYAGEAPTPEFSAGVVMIKAACSINLTPSHNPANYAGFKFNPSDGGPAGPEITSHIETIANDMLTKHTILESILPESVENIDLTGLYIRYINGRKTINISLIKRFIETDDCLICIDNVHGSTRGRMQRILGVSPKIKYLRTDDDYLFGGVAPEPSEKNMEGIEAVLARSGARYKLGIIMDPDGDRIRYADGRIQVAMNYFGAMALHYFYTYKGLRGIAVKSVATSNLVNALAQKIGVPLKETPVGFKNFRPYMLPDAPERAIVAFEESDGISGYNHTLEKDALFGLLVALEMMASTGMNIGDYLDELMDTYGHYYPDRSGISVDKSLVGRPLLDKLAAISAKFTKGAKINIAGSERTVTDVITIDGIKIVMDDASWLMIRPSGTEPKVRFYIESRTETGKKDVFRAAEEITKEALK